MEKVIEKIMIVWDNKYFQASKDLVTDDGRRNKAVKLSTTLKQELATVLCIKKRLRVHAKRSVSCSQILSLFLLFMLGSIAANIVLLQNTVMLFADHEEYAPDTPAKDKAIAVYRYHMVIEGYAIAIAMILAIAIGHLYEIWSSRKVLIIIFVLLSYAMLLPKMGVTES